MKRSQLALAIAGLLASSVSYATVDMTDAAKTTDASRCVSSWASELKATQTSVLTLLGNLPANFVCDDASTSDMKPLDVKIPVGFLVPDGDTRYIRVKLSDGAKFAQNPTCTVTASGTPTCSKSYGGKGVDFVTFSIMASGASIGPSAAVTIVNSATTTGAVAGITVADTTKSVQMTYTLHTNKDSAESVSNPDTAKISELGPFNFINFKPAIATSFTSGKTLISDVKKEFLKFENQDPNVASEEYGHLGSFAIGSSTYTVLIPDFSADTPIQSVAASGSNLTHILATGTTLEISSTPAGGFAFLQDVVNGAAAGSYNNAKTNGAAGGAIFFAADATNCIAGTTVTNPKDVNGDKALFNLDNIRTDGVGFVCVKANKLTTINAAEFAAVISPGSAKNSAPTKTNPFALNPIKQNGTVLDTPYFTSLPTTQYGSRIILSNTSTTKVPYKISVISVDGVTVTPGTLEGEISPQSLKKIEIKDVVSALSAGNNGAIRITLTGSNSWLSGVYQTIKKTTTGTGDIQSIPLIRQGGAAAGTAP
jgi:hypothetical protein